MKAPTMQDLTDLGFEIVKSYQHDEWITQVWKNGSVTVEKTWKVTGEHVSCEITIELEPVEVDFVTLEGIIHHLNNLKK